MLRMFAQHHKRPVLDLEGLHDFVFLGAVDPAKVKPANIKFNDRITIPMMYDMLPDYAGQRGLAAYRILVDLPMAGTWRLRLGGVHHWCQIFINGKSVATHSGGFTTFDTDLTHLLAGPQEIILLVDNRYDFQRCPIHHERSDFYHYGGISQGAELHYIAPVAINRVFISTTDHRKGTLQVRVQTRAELADKLPLLLTINGRIWHEEEIKLKPGLQDHTFTLDVNELSRWTPETPNLHMLGVELGADDYQERFGVREIKIKGKDILLNGKPLTLIGFNRHESYPNVGPATSDNIRLFDVQILRKMHCNFVRGAHYPQHPRFLDLCDEMGLLVWSEALGWQNKADVIADPHFQNAMDSHISEMVLGDFNHPSIFCWGLLNESESNVAKSKPGYRRFIRHIKALDPTRPVTYATHVGETDLCLDLVDILALNIYPGWYYKTPDDIRNHNAIEERMYHKNVKPHTRKPVIISEIGGDAITGYTDWTNQRWSEDYQADLLEAIITRLFLDKRLVCGLAIWQFCDMRTSESTSIIFGKPTGYNRKGVVNEYRLPKRSFHVVAKKFAEVRAKYKF